MDLYKKIQEWDDQTCLEHFKKESIQIDYKIFSLLSIMEHKETLKYIINKEKDSTLYVDGMSVTSLTSLTSQDILEMCLLSKNVRIKSNMDYVLNSISRFKRKDLLDLLFDQYDIDGSDVNNESFAYFCEIGDKAKVEKYIDGVDINYNDGMFYHLSLINGHSEISKILLDKNPNFDRGDNYQTKQGLISLIINGEIEKFLTYVKDINFNLLNKWSDLPRGVDFFSDIRVFRELLNQYPLIENEEITDIALEMSVLQGVKDNTCDYIKVLEVISEFGQKFNYIKNSLTFTIVNRKINKETRMEELIYLVKNVGVDPNLYRERFNQQKQWSDDNDKIHPDEVLDIIRGLNINSVLGD